ncbi:hypothetical protein HZH68_012684 [Vespula germanica]|uniref:Uncharacterized protein n=1 Tax=Vespula germanica TaxID=30212 RepID=A0A834MXH2_VESGE|nr:hypothetical protein HZH68_012684 [Vespula germanica]
MSEADGVDGGRKGISNANFRVESPLARGSPEAATSKRWDLGRLDHREMDHGGMDHQGMDHRHMNYRGNQGLVRLQFSENPETPEAERHLERECRIESPLARGSSDAATSKW